MVPTRLKTRVFLFLLLFLSCLPPDSQGTEEELSEYVVSECYGDIFNFDCGRGNKIRINKDFFGFSKERTCRYSKGECIISNPKSNSLIHRFCTGHRVCTYYLVERRGCGGSFSNYQQVEYQCIPDAMVTDICSTVDYKASSTYIASPNFPENYPPKLNCRCVVSATTPKAKVRMEIVYLAIKYTTPCRDWLSIGLRRTCGTTMDLFQGRRIPIEFRSDSDDSHSGFWLHFKSSIPGDKIHVQCGNVTLRPPRRDLHRKTFTGSEDGRTDAGLDHEDDVIERSPRPEDVPEERTTTIRSAVSQTVKSTVSDTGNSTVSGNVKSTVSDIVKSTVTVSSKAQNDPMPTVLHFTRPRVNTVGPSTVPTVVSTSERNTASRDQGLATVPTDDPGGSETGEKPDTPLRGHLRVVDEGQTRGPEQNTSNNFTRANAMSSSHDGISTGTNTDSTYLTDSEPADNGTTHRTISRLDDKEAWLKPVSNDLIPPDATSDDHFRSNRNQNRSQSVNNTLSSDGITDEADSAPATTQKPHLSSIVPSVATAPETDSFYTLGVVIISVCIAIGVLLVCIVLLVMYLRRHRTRDEETQTPRPKGGSDGDSGQGLLISQHRRCHTADKSLQVDLDSDVDVPHFLPTGRDVIEPDTDDFSLSSSAPCEPNSKGVQVTSNALAKARFRDRKRKRTKTLIGKSSSSGIDVKGCGLETTEGSSSECGGHGGARSYLRALAGDLSDPESYTYSSEQDVGHHRTSLASMSLYSEVTLMPENAILPSENDFYDSFSDPDWDQKSAISI